MAIKLNLGSEMIFSVRSQILSFLKVTGLLILNTVIDYPLVL